LSPQDKNEEIKKNLALSYNKLYNLDMINEDIKKRVGKNLRKLRGRKTLREIFRTIGIGDRYLSALERGKMNFTIDTLKKVADYFPDDHIRESLSRVDFRVPNLCHSNHTIEYHNKS